MPNQKTTKKTNKNTKSATEEPKKAADSKQPEVVVDNTKLKMTLTWNDVKTAYDQELKKAARNLKLKGFRKGKVPAHVAESQIGRVNLVQSTLEATVPQAYQELIVASGKRPLTPPQITPTSLEWEKDWELEVEIAETPQVKLGNYRTTIKKALKKAEKTIKEEAKQAAKPAAKKAQADADHNHAHDHDHDHAHDHDHHHDHAQQPSPEEKARETKLRQIFNQLIEEIQPKIPELLLKEETKRELNNLANELDRIGLKMDDYLARIGQSFEDLSARTAAQKLGQLQLEFILQKIQEEEKVEVTEQDFTQELTKIEDEKVREQIASNPQYRQYMEKEIERKKLLEVLLAVK